MRSKLTRAITLALAVCALSAVAAASASAALPEFKPSNGKFPALFSYSGTASFRWNGNEVACESMYGTGEIKNAKEVASQMYLKNCLSSEGRLYCWNEMSGSNYIIKTQSLEGIIGYYEENKTRGVGLEFNETWTKEHHSLRPPFAKFQCTGQPEVTLKGELIGKLTPVNESLEKFTLSYSNSEGVQTPDAISDGFLNSEFPEELEWNYGSPGELSSWLLTSTQYLNTSPAVEIEA